MEPDPKTLFWKKDPFIQCTQNNFAQSYWYRWKKHTFADMHFYFWGQNDLVSAFGDAFYRVMR